MRKISLFFLPSLLFLIFASAASSYAVPTITVVVPRRGPALRPITNLQLVIDVRRTAGSGSPTITLSNPAGPASFTFTAPTTLSSGGDDVVYENPALPTVTGGVFPAEVTRHRFRMTLLSDFDEADLTNCEDQMASDETWTVSVNAGFDIIGACALSFWRPTCGAAQLVNGDAAAGAPAAIMVGGVPFSGACERVRLPIDLAMVLDKSGSMASSTMGSTVGRPNRPKIEALRAAVMDMMTVWEGLRDLEDTGFHPGGAPADNVGVALFQSDAVWWPTLPATGLNSYLAASPLFTDANLLTITPGTATSIGDGLLLADGVLNSSDPLRRRVILVMSDGYQNNDKLVGINAADNVVTYPPADPTDTAELPNQNKYQIYSVTVGTDVAVSPVINQDIATKTGGFYINTEENADLMRPFFLELLQNFLKFNTVETVRMTSRTIAPGQPFITQVPITSTTEGLSINLMWGQGRMRLTATPPGGGPPITQLGSGRIHITQSLPMAAPYQPGQPWTIKVELLTDQGSVPFELYILTDDHGVESEQSIVAGNYIPGAPIRLETRVNVFGNRVRNIGSNPGDRVVAELVRPGVGIGDLLSDSTSPATQPQPGDPSSGALAKLQNTLQSDPSKLVRASDTISLLDNGNAANGDATAGDGIYSALYTPQIPGHYNFLFGVEAMSTEVGRLSRQQLKTVYVRAIPDAGNTQVQSAIQGVGDRRTLVINMTPRTRFNHRMGPGFANYFWFTTPGRPPFKARDNLNGSYTAELPFTGAPPDVTIHFIDEPIFIDDSVPPDKLPVPLDNSNVVEHVPAPPPDGGTGFRRWGLSLHSGVSIPHGNFNNLFNPGPNLGFDLEYRITRNFSIEGIYTFHRFNGEDFGFITVGDQDVHQFSINGKVYGSSSPVRPFFNFGAGAYKFHPGNTRGGVNVGGGVQFDVAPHISVDAMYNFHNVFTFGSNTRFSTVQGGVRFRF